MATRDPETGIFEIEWVENSMEHGIYFRERGNVCRRERLVELKELIEKILAETEPF